MATLVSFMGRAFHSNKNNTTPAPVSGVDVLKVTHRNGQCGSWQRLEARFLAGPWDLRGEGGWVRAPGPALLPPAPSAQGAPLFISQAIRPAVCDRQRNAILKGHSCKHPREWVFKQIQIHLFNFG